MITAICVLGVCIYFYFWSRRLKKEQLAESASLGQVEEHEAIEAIVTYFFLQKKRFSPQYMVAVRSDHIYSSGKDKFKVDLEKTTYSRSQLTKLEKKQSIHAFGYRRRDTFYANSIVPLHHEEN